MPQETELKLLIRPEDLPRLLSHPALQAASATRERLYNTYLDTPDLQLKARRMAVRERRIGRRTWLTVKTAGSSTGGMSVRGEWEAPTRPGEPDFRALLGDHPLADVLSRLAGRLVPVFQTDFVRRSWTLDHEGAVIEMALDDGQISAGTGQGGRSEHLQEIELELKAGPVTALFSLAMDLALPVQGEPNPGIWLMPSDLSKAQRGLALFEGGPLQAARAGAPVITPDMAPRAAFVTTAWSCLSPLQTNLGRLVLDAQAWTQPEIVHQSRVALRRLRTSLRLFRPWLPERFARHWDRQCQQLAALLGEVREWDVLETDWLPRLLTDGRDLAICQPWVHGQREAAWARARAALANPTQAQMLLALARGLHGLPVDAPNGRPTRLDRWARQVMAKAHQDLRREASQALRSGPEARHELRLSLKKERYTLESLACLLPPDEVRQATRALARAQDVLGWLNDLATARERLAPAPVEVRDRLLGRIDALERLEMRRLPGIERSLRDLAMFDH